MILIAGACLLRTVPVTDIFLVLTYSKYIGPFFA